jgi:hypothetical protein
MGMSLRRFIIVWTTLAFVVWLVAVSAFESDEDCSAPTAGYVCIETHTALLAGSLYVGGAPWALGLFVAWVVAVSDRRRRKEEAAG